MNRRPIPPHPDLCRRPQGGFGWLDASLLHDGWLANLGAEGTALLVLLAIAADAHGASFFGRERMARALSMTRPEIDRGLGRLLQLNLVAHRPWSKDHPDGVWQLMPTPRRSSAPTTGEPTTLRQALQTLGLVM